jgi:hypothetical protein
LTMGSENVTLGGELPSPIKSFPGRTFRHSQRAVAEMVSDQISGLLPLLPEMSQPQAQKLLYQLQGSYEAVASGDCVDDGRFDGTLGEADATSVCDNHHTPSARRHLPALSATGPFSRPQSATGRFCLQRFTRLPSAVSTAAKNAAKRAGERSLRLGSLPVELESVGSAMETLRQPVSQKPGKFVRDIPAEKKQTSKPQSMSSMAHSWLYRSGLRTTTSVPDDMLAADRLKHLSAIDIAANISVARQRVPEQLLSHLDSAGHLNLAHYGISDDDCTILAVALTGEEAPVQSIDVSSNGLAGRPFETLLGSFSLLNQLTHIDLGGNNMCRPQMEVLKSLLKHTNSLQILRLSSCDIRGFLHRQLVAGCLQATCLKELDISHNEISATAAADLSKLIALHPTLEDVCMDWCGMNQSATASIIQSCIENQANGGNLNAFSIEANKVGEETGQKLGVALRSSTNFRVINLARTDLGPRSAQVIASAMHACNSTLGCIDLSHNRFGPTGVRALLRAAIRSSNILIFPRSTDPRILRLASRRGVPVQAHVGIWQQGVDALVPRLILSEIGIHTPTGGAFDPMFPEATNRGSYHLDCSKAWDQAVLNDVIQALVFQAGFTIENAQLVSGGSKTELDFVVKRVLSTSTKAQIEHMQAQADAKMAEVQNDRDAATRLLGIMRRGTKDDAVLQRADAMVQWRSQRNEIIESLQTDQERLVRENMQVHVNGSPFLVPDSGIFTMKLSRKPQQPSVGLGASGSQIATLLCYLLQPSITFAERLMLLRLFCCDHWLTIHHAALLVNSLAEIEETKYSGRLLALRSEGILTVITQLVNPRHRDKLFELTLSSQQIKQFYRDSGALSRFQMVNPTGSYVLNLTNDGDRKVALLLLQANGADALQRSQLSLADASQRSPNNNFRNTFVNGRRMNLLHYLSRHGELPSGILATDYVCTRRPTAEDVVADNLEVIALLHELSVVFGDGHRGNEHIELFKANARAKGDTRKEMGPLVTRPSSPKAQQRSNKRLSKAVSFTLSKEALPTGSSLSNFQKVVLEATKAGTDADVIEMISDEDGTAAKVLAIKPLSPTGNPNEPEFTADWGSTANRRAQAKTLQQRWVDWQKREPDPFSDLPRSIQTKFTERLDVALEHLKVASADVYYNELQSEAIIKCFPSVPYSARALAIITIFSRLWKVKSAWQLLKLLSAKWAKHLVAEKLGYLNIFDPSDSKHSFELELENLDEHRLATMIIQMFSSESGSKFSDSRHNDLPGWQLPVSWLKEVPADGHWCFTFNPTSGSGVNSAVRKKIEQGTLLKADYTHSNAVYGCSTNQFAK